MKIRTIHKPLHPHAGMRKLSFHTLALAALLLILLLPSRLFSQAEPSALMELQSTDKGFLLPRMTQAQRDAIASPAMGLMIYNTTANCLQINYGSPAAASWVPLGICGNVGSLNCGSANVTGGPLASSQTAGSVSASVPYAGGDGGSHTGQTVNSTGVTGLTATLPAGSFANGSGNLVYTITGTPASAGTASFILTIGGQQCTLQVTVGTPTGCGAYVAPNQWKAFMCHNLASANTFADPYTPSWEINGGYWQWGRKAMAAAGPSGPGAGEANAGPINGWNTTIPPNGAWSDASKTADDPCPQGFRVPTLAQWQGVLANNTQSITGTWTESSTNYSSGRFFGPGLMLPAAGFRYNLDGQLFARGLNGNYWSSTESGTVNAWYLYFNGGGAVSSYDYRRYGLSLRCLAE